MTIKISPHFTRAEFERDDSVIPDEAIVDAYVQLCVQILEPLRAWAGEPFYITSGYRSPEVNARIGSDRSSQHIATANYCAVDGYFESHPTMEAPFNWLRLGSRLLFDQIIREDGKYRAVLHISWAREPRRMALEGKTYGQATYTAAYVAPITTEAT